MDIAKIQKLIHKAIKEYSISAKYDEDILVLFLTSDFLREANGLNDVPEKIKRTPTPTRDIEVL